MPVHLDAHLPVNHRLAAVSGVGGLNPWRRPPCYRTPPHAQIFYFLARVLNCFLIIGFSNGPPGRWA
jgi:hypothetical protein